MMGCYRVIHDGSPSLEGRVTHANLLPSPLPSPSNVVGALARICGTEVRFREAQLSAAAATRTYQRTAVDPREACKVPERSSRRIARKAPKEGRRKGWGYPPRSTKQSPVQAPSCIAFGRRPIGSELYARPAKRSCSGFTRKVANPRRSRLLGHRSLKRTANPPTQPSRRGTASDLGSSGGDNRPRPRRFLEPARVFAPTATRLRSTARGRGNGP